ncbi:MAG: Ig-like domain-containing protein, partial [Oscillospiraceae bacterium]
MTITTGTIASPAGSAQNPTVTDASGNVYTAIIKSGIISGGSTGTVNIEIHKYSQSSGTWSKIASLADGLGITPTTYFGDTMALAIDDSGNLGITYTGRANIKDASNNIWSTARGVFHRELDLSNNQWGTESDVISVPIPSVWTTSSDNFYDVRLAYDGLGNAVVGYERSFNSGMDQGKQAIFVAQQSGVNWNTSEVAKESASSAYIAEIGYMVKSGNNVYLSYTKGDGLYLDVKLSSSQDWTASTTIIDSTSDTDSYNLWGMTGNSNGSLNILYTGGGAGGVYDNASFGVISNTFGSWQLPSDISTRIANADGLSPSTDGQSPDAYSVNYDRFFTIAPGAQGYLVTNSSNQSFFIAYYGTYIEAQEWSVWAKIGDNWIKGYNNISELNSFKSPSGDYVEGFTPVVINGDQLMFTYSPARIADGPRTVEYVTGKISDFVSTGPSVTSIVRAGGAGSTVQHGTAAVSYTVTFSESVSGVSTDDFTLTPTGNATGSIASVSGSGSTYTVIVNSLAGDGMLRLDLKSSDTGITGSGSIAITGGYTSGNTYTLDHTAPAAPSVPAMDPDSDTGASSADHITNQASPTFTGTAEAGSTVTLYDTDGTTVLGSAVATGGNWTIVPNAPLSQGSHDLTAKATDAAGNPSSASSTLTVVIDTAAPTGFGLDKTSVPAASTGSNVAVATLQSSDASDVAY